MAKAVLQNTASPQSQLSLAATEETSNNGYRFKECVRGVTTAIVLAILWIGLVLLITVYHKPEVMFYQKFSRQARDANSRPRPQATAHAWPSLVPRVQTSTRAFQAEGVDIWARDYAWLENDVGGARWSTMAEAKKVLERRESSVLSFFSERPSNKTCKQLLQWIIVGVAISLLCAAFLLFVLIYHLPEVSLTLDIFYLYIFGSRNDIDVYFMHGN